MRCNNGIWKSKFDDTVSSSWSILKSNEWTIIIYFSYLIRIPLLFHLPSISISACVTAHYHRSTFANRERWYCHRRWYSHTSNHYALRIVHKINRHLLHSICLMTSNMTIIVMHSYTQLHLYRAIKKELQHTWVCWNSLFNFVSRNCYQRRESLLAIELHFSMCYASPFFDYVMATKKSVGFCFQFAIKCCSNKHYFFSFFFASFSFS